MFWRYILKQLYAGLKLSDITALYQYVCFRKDHYSAGNISMLSICTVSDPVCYIVLAALLA